jgi:osmotically-inducible protein OsmY
VRAVASNDIGIKLFWQRTDPEIARAAVNALENNVGIPNDRITVTVKNGWITLEGSVDWLDQKTLVESAIKKLRRVLGITDKIEVEPTVSPASELFPNKAAKRAQPTPKTGEQKYTQEPTFERSEEP